jgi:phage repressor protein C with HTH and peptisase S24 domain
MVEWNDRLVNLLEERGMSVADLARAIDGPHFHAVKERLYKYAKPGKTVPEPRGKMMANIARALGVTEQYLRYGSDTPAKIVAIAPSVTGPDPTKPIDVFVPREVPLAQSGSGQMGLYGTTSAGKGALLLDNEPFEQIQRSESLANVRDPYAVVVDGDSMIPALRHGYVVHVNPHLKPQSDDICIFQQEQADGTRLACIKAFRKQTETHWHVTQYNPPAGERPDFVLKKTEWPLVHVVVYIDPRRR